MNGYIYIVIPKDIHNHIHYELSKIGYFTTDNIEKTIHNNYSRSMGSYIIYEQIPCNPDNVRKYEKIIHLMLQDYRNKPPHEVFNLSSLKAKETIKYFKDYVINIDSIVDEHVPNDVILKTEKEKFIQKYNLNHNIVKIFESVLNKIINSDINESQFKELIKNKLLFTSELFELFQKYILINKYNLDEIDIIFNLKNVLDKYIQESENEEDSVSKKEIKNILKEHKIKINDIDLIKTIEELYDCEFCKDKQVKGKRFRLEFIKMVSKNKSP